MGDHLYITAMQLAIEGRTSGSCPCSAETTLGMIEGEMIQKDQNGRAGHRRERAPRGRPPQDGACSSRPAAASRPCSPSLEPEQQRALESYGLDLGMAYQLVDDLLDFTAGREDARQADGERSARRQADAARSSTCCARGSASRRARPHGDGGPRLQRVPREAITESAAPARLLEEGARPRCDTPSARAASRLFPESRYKDALHSVLDFVIERDR
jgi:octaprenyl-diphosphate synthase